MKKLILPALLALLVTGCTKPIPEEVVKTACTEQLKKVAVVLGEPLSESYSSSLGILYVTYIDKTPSAKGITLRKVVFWVDGDNRCVAS